MFLGYNDIGHAIPTDARGKAIITWMSFMDVILSLLRCYRSATPVQLTAGRVWYTAWAHRILDAAEPFDVHTDQALAIFAVLSPQRNPDHNMRLMIAALRDVNSAPITGAQKVACRAIRASVNPQETAQYVTGRKVSAFYANLMGDVTHVTVDRHMVTLALATPNHTGNVTLRDWRIVDAATRVAASILDTNPRDVQAVCWVTHRDAHVHEMHGLTAPAQPATDRTDR